MIDNEIKNEDIQVPNSSKINSIIEKYQTRVDELEAQLLDQDDLIQEHEKSTQTLMSSFRSRCAALLEESHLLRKKYEANLAEEKLLNSQLAQENFKLRSLLQKLTDSVKSGILDHLEEDEMIYQEELSRLESENSSLRNLLKISENL
ncbi:hypothetical protein K502DRAFT_325504 [Neoconidiobolus thromboides FSU 785]|nr:hypothetical protein K502DRAFT_325504 [Neoconidiobolus thromboides FSU 785]